MHAAVLSIARDYNGIAKNYAKFNEPQLEVGRDFVAFLAVKPGDKVVDMGCGTGELTSYVAARVGRAGRVVGVDPDAERIKVATRKCLNGSLQNLSFVTGDSSSRFSHSNEEYYDIHFSNHSFHWLTAEEKYIFLKTAMECLKPNGRIAIHCLLEDLHIFTAVQSLLPAQNETSKPPTHYVPKAIIEAMLNEVGFVEICSDFVEHKYTFGSVDNFLTWYCASDYIDEAKISAEKRERFSKEYANNDGTLYLKATIYQVVAKKRAPIINYEAKYVDQQS